jgi:hypothetical protein
VRTGSGGGNSEVTTSVSATLRLSIANDGAVTAGGGNGCSASGKLNITNAATGSLAGTITLSGCTDPAFNGGYAAVATSENGGALEVEMEREVETSASNIKTKVKGRLARA